MFGRKLEMLKIGPVYGYLFVDRKKSQFFMACRFYKKNSRLSTINVEEILNNSIEAVEYYTKLKELLKNDLIMCRKKAEEFQSYVLSTLASYESLETYKELKDLLNERY